MERLHNMTLAIAALFILSAQAPAGPGYEELCAAILQERTEFMEECVAAQAESHYFVMDWFAQNGLLTPDGEIDSLQLLQAQTDPMRALYETPASAAAFCIETSGDWIGMSECIALTDQNSLFMGNDPLMMGPELGPEFGPGVLPQSGVN